MSGLTKSQKKIIDFVSNFIYEKGYSPTFREIQSHFGFASLGSVYTYVKMLKKKGLIQDQKRSSIALTSKDHLAETKKSEILLPLIGYLAAGFPIETFPQSQSIPVTAHLVPNPENTYVMKIKGDTLIDEHIIDGDYVLVEARTEAEAGELIVGNLHQHKTIVKRYFPEGSYLRLESSDGRHEPIILNPDELQIQGVIVHLLRVF